MLMMFVWILLYLAAFAALVFGGIMMDEGIGFGVLLFVVGLIWVCAGWLPFLGLKVLGPQEALVLTLFGKYIGTLKDSGF